MDPIPTLDAMLARPDADPERLRRAAERAAAAAVADWRELRAIDQAAGVWGHDTFDRPTAAAQRAQYEAWVAVAERLEQRLATVAQRVGDPPVDGAEEVSHTIGKTLAQLSITLDSLEESAREFGKGPSYTLEEVRRELRLHAKA